MTTETRVLEMLRSEREAAVSLSDMARRLNMPVEQLQRKIDALRKSGYEIESSPHQGLILRSGPDCLHRDDLLSMTASNEFVGRDIQVFQETTSTNDVADKCGRDGVPEGIVIFAESQTRGRGRLGRGWFSPPGKGLWFSVLLRPELRPQGATQLTIAAAASVARALERHADVSAQIKWPNDVQLSGKKVAGVLTEMSAEIDRIKYMIVGIGLDVNLNRDELPQELRETATSLRIETGRVFRRADLAAAILTELDRDYRRIHKGRFAEIAEEWERRCATLGQQVSINMGGRVVRGRAESLDDDGALLLRTEHGRLERIIGGDVTTQI